MGLTVHPRQREKPAATRLSREKENGQGNQGRSTLAHERVTAALGPRGTRAERETRLVVQRPGRHVGSGAALGHEGTRRELKLVHDFGAIRDRIDFSLAHTRKSI